MDSSFTIKTLRIAVVLGEGTFSGHGNTKIIEGLGTDVSISKPGPPEKNKATVKIAGLKIEDMAEMTTLAFKPLKTLKNLVTIQAGDFGASDLPVAFTGEIVSAYADFNQAPDALFAIEAQTGSYPALVPSPQETVRGQADAASLIAKYAKEIGYAFKNEGVSASVKNAVLNGSPIEKIRAVANQIGCELLIDDSMVVIMPSGGARSGNAVYLSKESGMLGYPTFTSDGLQIKALYNPEFKIGGLVEVKSIVPRSSGVWKVTKLDHSLVAHKPGGGAWSSTLSTVHVNG
jgi:hypothetical protein